MDETLAVVLAIAVLLIVLGFVALLKQKLYVDSETGQVTEVEVPLLGKLRTNAPAIAFVVFGSAITFGAMKSNEQRLDRLSDDLRVDAGATETWTINGRLQLPSDVVGTSVDCGYSQGPCISLQDGTLRLIESPIEDLQVADNGEFLFEVEVPKGLAFEDWMVNRIVYEHRGLTGMVTLFTTNDPQHYFAATTRNTRTLATVEIPRELISIDRLHAALAER